MHTPILADRDQNHRFPAAIISHAIGLYVRCCLSDRDGEELLCVGGVLVSDEALRKWCRTVGHQYATPLRRRRSRPGATWPLAAGFLTLKGEPPD